MATLNNSQMVEPENITSLCSYFKVQVVVIVNVAVKLLYYICLAKNSEFLCLVRCKLVLLVR